jgi:hypothetical protein
LILSAKPGLSPKQIKIMLQRNASTLGLKSQPPATRGEVSASKTLKSIMV